MTRSAQKRGMILSMMAGGFIAGFAVAWTDVKFANLISPTTAALIVTVLMLAGCAAAVPIWTRLDEVVREAHKSAWYWGGTAGMCLAIGVMTFAFRDATNAIGAWASNLTVSTGLATGIALCVGLQTLGYGLGWLVWWLSKR